MATFTIEQTLKAQRSNRRIAYSFFIVLATWEGVVKATLGPLYLREREAAPILQEDTFDMHKHSRTI